MVSKHYFEDLSQNLLRIDTNSLNIIIKLLEVTIKRKNFVFCCGNGGSAAISNHFEVDFIKGVNQASDKQSRFISLSSNVEIISAIANDTGFENIFLNQFKILAKKNDVIFCISSSGNSKNIIKILQYAKNNGYKSVLLSGFDGGKGKKLANYNIHIKSHNYGIVEDCHQSIMHFITQALMKKIKI